MLLALVLAAITALALAAVVLPLTRGVRAAPGRDEFDRAVYRDQLKELDREAARGVIGEVEAASARLEIERRLLAAEPAPGAAPIAGRKLPWVAAALTLLIAGGSAGIYLKLGSPGVPDEPYDARGPERALVAANGHTDLAKSADALEAKLAANPGDADGWLLYARTSAALERWQKSADAYRHALALSPGRPDIAAAYGEMLVMAADGIVTPAAHDAFDAALAHDPRNGLARYYLGLAEAQAGNAAGAIAAWQMLASEAEDGAPIRAELRHRIEEAASAAGIPVPPLAPPQASGPDAEQMAQAVNMAPDQRAAMIHSMVDKLAAQLAAAPDDLEGWLRLARAYGVLGEADKAEDAYDQAAKLAPDDARIPLGEAEAMLAGRALADPIPDKALGLLHRAEALSPDDPAILWYLGLASAQAHRAAEARGYWQRLLTALPADAPERKTVTAALEAIKDK